MAAKKQNVIFQSADAGQHQKFEGFSGLSKKHDEKQRSFAKNAQAGQSQGLKDEYSLNLHRQIALMEHQIKMLKEREVDQKNRASGYETLLRDGIPLNEHFLALKNKFNNEQDMLKKQVDLQDAEVRGEENVNKQKNQKINILKREFEDISTTFQEYKEVALKKMKDLETKLFTEQHTKDLLAGEKTVLSDKVGNLKASNMAMARTITKDKYHNNREEIEKERKKAIDETKSAIAYLTEQIEGQQALLEEEQERNSDPNLLKRQKEVTMNLKQDQNKLKTDITVAENRIKDLETRREMLYAAIEDILRDKRRVDKYNMELEDKISGRNVTEEMTKRKQKNAERRQRIKLQKNLDNLRQMGVILMDKTSNEESKSKEVLDEKLKLEQELNDLREDLQIRGQKMQLNRDDLIKLRVLNSQLDSQTAMLTVEEAQLGESNDKLLEQNGLLEIENAKLSKQIQELIQSISVNNLLRDIDIEELQLLAKNNRTMNQALEKLINQWEYVETKFDSTN